MAIVFESVTKWSFVKPGDFAELRNRVRTVFKRNNNVVYAALAVCVDDIGNNYLQGYIQTADPINMDMMIDLFGSAIYSPCLESENPTLTEILM